MSHKIARLSARLPGAMERVWGRKGSATVDAQMLEAAMKMHIKEMRERLDRAAAIAKAAETCVNSGNIEKAVEIALDVEQLIYEVNTLLSAASLMRQLRED